MKEKLSWNEIRNLILNIKSSKKEHYGSDCRKCVWADTRSGKNYRVQMRKGERSMNKYGQAEYAYRGSSADFRRNCLPKESDSRTIQTAECTKQRGLL